MRKINFIDYQEPAMSANTMNTLQTNVEDAIEEVAGRIVGIGAAPIGSIIAWTTAAAPRGWLVCDGSAISRVTYADLFAVVGTAYGSGDGSTTFNLPNLKGRIPVGEGSNDGGTHYFYLGSTGGEYEHTLTVDEMPAHKHDIYVDETGTGGIWGPMGTQQQSLQRNAITGDTGGGTSHNNLQPFIVLNYIIKATKQEANTVSESLPVGTELDYDGNVADIPTGWEQVDDPSIFSTTEKVVGTWIDNKPLYRKTITFTNELSAANPLDISTNITNPDLIFVDTSHSFAYKNGVIVPLPQLNYYDNFSDRIGMTITNDDSGHLHMYSETTYDVYWTKVVTVLYTKTTD